MKTALSVLLLLAVLGFAVAKPRQLPEMTAALPAAILCVVLGLVTFGAAVRETAALLPTVAFLALILVLAYLADREGVFRYAAGLAARYSRGSPRRLLRAVFVIAAVCTAALSLDATVVLLTPVVLTAAATIRVRARPVLYACTHLANSASLLLPVSNLTNLLAFHASGLSFWRFGILMAAPWVAVIAVEYLVLSRFFSTDLSGTPDAEPPRTAPPPVVALVILGATFAGFALVQPIGISPAWIALAGVLAMLARRLLGKGEERVRDVLRAANPLFLVFVLSLGIVVLAVRNSAFGGLVGGLIPARTNLASMLAVAVTAAVLANLVNNLPATLMLVPLVGHSPALVLAMLIGVNVGPNLTYVGSLATLLWRQILHARDQPPDARQFMLLGAATVPACVVAGVVTLWLASTLSGMA